MPRVYEGSHIESWQIDCEVAPIQLRDAAAEARLLQSTIRLHEQLGSPDLVRLDYIGEPTVEEPLTHELPSKRSFLENWDGVMPQLMIFRSPTRASYFVKANIPSIRPDVGTTTVDNLRYEIALPARDHAGAILVQQMCRHLMKGSPPCDRESDVRVRRSSILSSVTLGVEQLRRRQGYPGTWTWKIGSQQREVHPLTDEASTL